VTAGTAHLVKTIYVGSVQAARRGGHNPAAFVPAKTCEVNSGAQVNVPQAGAPS